MIRIETILEKAEPYCSDEDLDLLRRAYVFSAQAHSSELGSWALSRAGWSASSSSMTMARARAARSLALCTTMPASGWRTQEAASTRSPSISTMQARQLPSAR